MVTQRTENSARDLVVHVTDRYGKEGGLSRLRIQSHEKPPSKKDKVVARAIEILTEQLAIADAIAPAPAKPAQPDMTTAEALDILIDIAGRWGENAEEAFPRRISPSDTDDDIRALVHDPYEFEDAVEIRNLWRAIELIRKQTEPTSGEH